MPAGGNGVERGDRARAGALQKPRRRSDRQEQTFVTSGQLRRGRRRALRVKTADFDADQRLLWKGCLCAPSM